MRRSVLPLALLAALLVPGAAGSAPVERGTPLARPALDTQTQVLAVSIDGLNPAALKALGRRRAPTLHRLVAEGASTLNARTERELTLTLPNHTGMVTGRRIDPDRRGHGVDWNDHRPGTTVHEAAGHQVASVFSVVQAAGGTSAVFTGKEKFSLFDRSWPGGVDRYEFDEDALDLVRAARADLKQADRAFTLLHLATPDVAGHEHGFMSQRYLDAVAETDALLAKIVRAIERDRDLAKHLVLVLTADHGGKGDGHYDVERYADYRVPFLAWGAGIEPAGLYAINPDLRAPGTRRTSYAGRQPVRNGAVANVATSLLGLGPVPGSTIGRGVDVTR